MSHLFSHAFIFSSDYSMIDFERKLPGVLAYAVFFGMLLAVFLEKSTSKYDKLALDFLHCRDDSLVAGFYYQHK